jgi:hypothetical protein
MESTCPNCHDSSLDMHGACLLALGSHAPSDHRSEGDKPNCGSGEYPENHATAPRTRNKLSSSIKDDGVGNPMQT